MEQTRLSSHEVVSAYLETRVAMEKARLSGQETQPAHPAAGAGPKKTLAELVDQLFRVPPRIYPGDIIRAIMLPEPNP